MKDCLKSITDAQAAFNPRILITSRQFNRLKTGELVIQKEKIIRTPQDEAMFMIILHTDYKWNYEDYNNTTIYFNIEDGCIIGGVYSTKNNTCLTRCVIANPTSPRSTDTTYIYSVDDCNNFKNIFILS